MNRRVAGDLFDEVRRIDPLEKLDAPLGEAPLPIDAVILVVIAQCRHIHLLCMKHHFSVGVDHARGSVRVAGVKIDDMTVLDMEARLHDVLSSDE